MTTSSNLCTSKSFPSEGSTCPSSPKHSSLSELDFDSRHLVFPTHDLDYVETSKLKSDSNKLKNKYQYIFTKLRKYIRDNQINISRIILVLENYDNVSTIFPTTKEIKNVENITDMTELMGVIKNYSSFFNFELLELIMIEIDYDEGLQMLEVHKKNLKEYAQRRIIDCPSGLGAICGEHTSCYVMLDDAFNNCKLEYLFNLKDDLCEILQLNVNLCLLHGVYPGSIWVIFHFLSPSSNYLPLSAKQLHQLAKLNYGTSRILRLMCEYFVYDINKDTLTDNLSKSSNSICEQVNISWNEIKNLKMICDEVVQNCKLALDISNNKIETIHSIFAGQDLPNIIAIINSNKNSILDKDTHGHNGLQYAAREGKMILLKYLIEELGYDSSVLDEHQHTLLHLATINNHQDIVQYLLHFEHTDVYKQDIHGWTALYYSSALNYLHIFQCLIMSMKKFKSLDDIVHNGQYILIKGLRVNFIHIAIFQGSVDILKYIFHELGFKVKDLLSILLSTEHDYILDLIMNIDQYEIELRHVVFTLAATNRKINSLNYFIAIHKCNISVKDSNGNSVLHYLAYFGNLEMVKYFTNILNCNPNVTGMWGRTPLHDASQRGHLDVVKHLVEECKCDPLTQDEDKYTPIHLSSGNGHLEIVKYFILGCCLDVQRIRDDQNNTPIHFAALLGQLDTVKFFMEDLKCDPNIRGRWERSPLHNASQGGHLHLVKYLVEEHKCDPIIEDQHKSTPIHVSSGNGHMDLIKYFTLVCKHTIHDVRNDDNRTPVHDAAFDGHLDILKYFMEDLNCDPNIRGWHDRTLLHDASQQGHLCIVKYLTECHKLDPLCPDQDGVTPLHLACGKGHLEVVQSFNQCGAMQSKCVGYLPIHHAAYYNHLHVIKYLIEEMECDPETLEQNGKTALQIATEKGHTEIIDYLKQRIPSKDGENECDNEIGNKTLDVETKEVTQVLLQIKEDPKNIYDMYYKRTKTRSLNNLDIIEIKKRKEPLNLIRHTLQWTNDVVNPVKYLKKKLTSKRLH